MKKIVLICVGSCLLVIASCSDKKPITLKIVEKSKTVKPSTEEKVLVIPSWAIPERGVSSTETISELKKALKGSAKKYTQLEIDDKFNAPDWFPEQHVKMPDIVKYGRSPKIWACASCHLASGHGHPESSTLAGLTEVYMVAQLTAFSNGNRIDYSGHMNRMAALMTTKEITEASRWFASLKPKQFVQVREVDEVSKTYVDGTRMRQIDTTSKQTEAIGKRIIEVPMNKERVHKRDPWASFVSYVPIGSIARGKILVETGGGKTTACATCHHKGLTGSTIGPALAGNFGIYTLRQLYAFKQGTRKNPTAAIMLPIVANLTPEDMVDISAYISSLSPGKE